MKINGREIADDIIARLKERETPKKILAAVLVGDDPRSESFIKQKEKVSKELGVDFRTYRLSGDLKNDDLRGEVGRIAKQKPVGGVLVQLPLPGRVSRRYVVNAVPKEKDVDVLGERSIDGKILSPAVGTVKEILERMLVQLESAVVAVIGKGALVGGPISVWLRGECKELLILDSKSDLKTAEGADIVISGVGKPGVLDPGILKDGAGVIDFGYSYSSDGKILGDLAKDNEEALNRLNFYTPTPGGTGPILVAKLLENFYMLCGK